MKNVSLFFLLITFVMQIVAQEEKPMDDLPYYEVPEYYKTYTVGTVSARMIDGLGFRYRWSTEDLREVDLVYRPSEGARTVLETIDHVYGLSKIIVNTVSEVPTDFTIERSELSYIEKRTQTLENFKKASDILKEIKDLEELKIKFVSKNGSSEYPFWDLINGPIEDAVWHSGQLVSFRRSSGNPMNPKVNFLTGKVRD
jgi:hypothetical protein